jgi:hypothetical protein
VSGSRGARGWRSGRASSCPCVFTLPAALGDIAYQNKAAIYDLLFKASAETMLTIAPIPSISAPASPSPPC